MTPNDKHYPQAWKDCCSQIFQRFKSEAPRLYGRSFGWSQIRNMVMYDYDTYEDGKLVEASSQLRRQDLEHWAAGKRISNPKFFFIDRFLHAQLIDKRSAFQIVARDVIRYRDLESLNAQELLFGAKRRPADRYAFDAFDNCRGCFFSNLNKEDSDDNLYTTIYVKRAPELKFLATVFYTEFPPESVEDLLEEGYFVFGYITPRAEGNSGQVHGILNLFDRRLGTQCEMLGFSTSRCSTPFKKEGSFTIATAASGYDPIRFAKRSPQRKAGSRSVLIPRLRDIPVGDWMNYRVFKEILPHQADDPRVENLLDEYLLW